MAMTQVERNKKWREGNREIIRYLNARSAARTFVSKRATPEDLAALADMIRERLAEEPPQDI